MCFPKIVQSSIFLLASKVKIYALAYDKNVWAKYYRHVSLTFISLRLRHLNTKFSNFWCDSLKTVQWNARFHSSHRLDSQKIEMRSGLHSQNNLDEISIKTIQANKREPNASISFLVEINIFTCNHWIIYSKCIESLLSLNLSVNRYEFPLPISYELLLFEIKKIQSLLLCIHDYYALCIHNKRVLIPTGGN